MMPARYDDAPPFTNKLMAYDRLLKLTYWARGAGMRAERLRPPKF